MGRKMKIYRDQNGICINIGDWDYQFDNENKPRNPLPEGAVESDEEVIVGWDGGRYAHDDPRAVKS
jgi:hypothetical protein